MSRYLQVFKISFEQEFAYRINFIMWRVRNVMQIILVFFLWDVVYSDPSREIFGYNRGKILTYVFMLVFIKAFVLSARAREVAGEISRGDLVNTLVKPINYFKYWLARDISSKSLNIAFSVVEVIILYLVLKPPFFVQTDILTLTGFTVAVILAIFTFFLLLFIISSICFWVPEAAWGAHFLLTVVVVEFLSGAIFPLDILPHLIQALLNYTPFPYLIFFPIQIYLGNIAGAEALKGLSISAVWVLVLWLVMNNVWRKGLKSYQTFGK